MQVTSAQSSGKRVGPAFPPRRTIPTKPFRWRHASIHRAVVDTVASSARSSSGSYLLICTAPSHGDNLHVNWVKRVNSWDHDPLLLGPATERLTILAVAILGVLCYREFPRHGFFATAQARVILGNRNDVGHCDHGTILCRTRRHHVLLRDRVLRDEPQATSSASSGRDRFFVFGTVWATSVTWRRRGFRRS